MTPEQAQKLLDAATPGPWEHDGAGCVGNYVTREIVCVSGPDMKDDPQAVADRNMIIAAPVLAELVASLRYEYAVQVGMDGKFAYAFMADTGKFRFGPLALADWWQTHGEAADLVADMKSMNPHTTACVVRRLVGEPEVVE